MQPFLTVVLEGTLNKGFRLERNLLNPSYSIKRKGTPCKDIILSNSYRDTSESYLQSFKHLPEGDLNVELKS
jgi:hypothetical protein